MFINNVIAFILTVKYKLIKIIPYFNIYLNSFTECGYLVDLEKPHFQRFIS